MSIVNMRKYIRYEMNRIDDDDGVIYYQIMEIDGDHCIDVSGPNAKQIAYKILRKLNEVKE